MTLRATAVASLLLAIVAIPAVAQNDVYDNGPTDGQTYAWTINFGFIVSNSFDFVRHDSCFPRYQCGINGLTFAAWLFPGDVLQSVEVSITSSEFGGTTYFDQTVALFQSDCIRTQYNGEPFDLCNETGSFQDVYLNTGTYWLNLQNAVVDTGDPVYWDENNGPSQASENSVGTIPSESFTILGETTSTTCPWCGYTPEPNSFLLVASGLGVIAISLAGKLFVS
jgi:hypothetical protein